jgi:hypothetical protein
LASDEMTASVTAIVTNEATGTYNDCDY